MKLLSIVLSLVLSYMPKGTLQEVIYPSSVPGPSERRMLVYLPEGYGNSDARYPVLYLFHGARGTEEAWISNGDILREIDSLRAEKRIVPFILVLPNMNFYTGSRDYGDSRKKNPIESLFEIDGAVEMAFMHDVVGYIDGHYRTVPDKKHRAIAGLSIGGLQSIYISANNPDSFDYIGMFSPMYTSPHRPGRYNVFYKYLKDKQEVQFCNPPAVYFIAIGRADVFYLHMVHYRCYLKSRNYPFEYMESGGGHDWVNWKPYCAEFMKKCFR